MRHITRLIPGSVEAEGLRVSFPTEGVTVANNTARVCYLRLGATEIPTESNADYMVPANVVATLPTSGQDFGLALSASDTRWTANQAGVCTVVFWRGETVPNLSSMVLDAVQPSRGVWGVSDLGELAARLGAPSTWDRRGYQVWAWTPDRGLGPLDRGSTGAGSSVSLDSTWTYAHEVCAKLTGLTIGGFSIVHKPLPYVSYARVGIEAVLSISETEVPEFAQVGIIPRKGGRTLEGRLRFYPSDKSIRMLKSDGTWLSLAILSTLWQNDVWHVVKLVVDMSTNRYVRAIYDDQSYDLSAYALRDTGASAYSSVDMLVSAYATAAGAAGTARVGQLVITRNEP